MILLALIAAATSFTRCGDDAPPAEDPQDVQLTKLSQTWKASNVTFNSTPVTGYENFQIIMSGTKGQDTFSYTSSGRPVGVLTPWAASGTFTFGTDFSTVLIRDQTSSDVTTVTYSVTDTQLQMTFTYAGSGYVGSRVTNVNGSWSFTFGL